MVDILVIVYRGDSLTLGYIYIERRDLMPRFVTVERAWRSVFFPCKGLGCVVGVGWVGWDIDVLTTTSLILRCQRMFHRLGRP